MQDTGREKRKKREKKQGGVTGTEVEKDKDWMGRQRNRRYDSWRACRI
jgi:hypothetical protein